jgi:hypothetical protein
MGIPSVTGRRSGRSVRVRAAVLLVVVVGVSSAAVAHAAGSPPFVPPPSRLACDHHRGTTLLQSGSLVVYGTDAGTNALGQTRIRYWTCTLPDGASTLLGTSATGGKYPANATVRRITITGSYVAAIESSGVGAAARCVAADGHFCRRPGHAVVLVDAKHSSSSTLAIHGAVGRLLVGADGATGAAVWTQAVGNGQIKISSVVTRSSGKSSEGVAGMVAEGPIDPSSLSLDGLRLRYTEHGKAHSVNLARRL